MCMGLRIWIEGKNVVTGVVSAGYAILFPLQYHGGGWRVQRWCAIRGIDTGKARKTRGLWPSDTPSGDIGNYIP